MGLLLLVRMTTEWQNKSFGFFFGYTGVGSSLGDPRFEMASAFPEL